MKQKHIAILDFGSQYMHLITRRIRQMGVLAKIYPTDVKASDLSDAWGVIISGGPNSVNDQKLPYDPAVFDLPVPILGLCYGHQLMAHHYGGVVTPAHNREYGKATLTVKQPGDILNLLAEQEQVWMSHWDSVTEVPNGFEVVGVTDDCPVGAMANTEKRRYGLQFHPEVHHSENGMQVLRNFVFDICGAEENWSMQEYLEELKERIRTHVGDRNVFLFVSGGVDSSVAFALLEDILGKKRVYGLHVDNGFMRLNESQHVAEALASAGFDDLHVVDASEDFLNATAGLVDPEEKRKAIGKTFLDVQKRVFDSLDFNPDEWMLGQGTIYPDTIETGGTEASDTIKTHHNRVDEVMEMIKEGRVIEPLADLYKDEVRALGRELGLSDELIDRWPFPGPGLSIRTLCSSGDEHTIENGEGVEQNIQEVMGDVEHLSAGVLPLRSVGVQGDFRSYEHPAVVVPDEQYEIDWAELDAVSVALTNGVSGINRVIYFLGGDVDPFDPHTPKATLTQERLDVLREADNVVNTVIEDNAAHDTIWQFPVILVPLSYNGGESVVLRPIVSEEAMTVNFYPMPQDIVEELTSRLLAIEGIDAVFYDITNKPPATIEWE